MWVATIFCLARTHIRTLDFRPHAHRTHVCVFLLNRTRTCATCDYNFARFWVKKAQFWTFFGSKDFFLCLSMVLLYLIVLEMQLSVWKVQNLLQNYPFAKNVHVCVQILEKWTLTNAQNWAFLLKNVRNCDRTSHTSKMAARTHIAHTLRKPFRTHIAHVRARVRAVSYTHLTLPTILRV